MRMRWILLGLVILVAACGSSVSTTSTSTTTSSADTAAASSTTSSTTPVSIGCPQEEDFVATGQIDRVTQPSSDSRTLGLISRQIDDGCERFGFDFDTAEDAPATTPPSVNAFFLEGERVIRIVLDIDRTVINDQLIETELVDRLYVVRGLDGTMFVDIHLNQGANAHVVVSNSPARMVLELNTAPTELTAPASIAENVVLLQPPNEAEVDVDTALHGYARVFEANVLILATSGDEVVVRSSTTAADSVETWGEFRATVSLPLGSIDLFVGEESPVDGSLDGVTLKLSVR